jgi:hypothetical protein
VATDIQARVTGLLWDPRAEWGRIAGSPHTAGHLWRNYILILAAIPAVASTVGLLAFELPVLGRWGVTAAVSAGVAGYVSSLVTLAAAASIVAAMAPRFGSRGTATDALVLVAYAATPVWVAGILYLVVVLSWLVIAAGLYAIYLCYLGLPVVMKTPAEQVVPFMTVAGLLVLVVNIVVHAVASSLGVPVYF